MEPVKGCMLAKVPEAAQKMMKEKDATLSPSSYAIRFAASLDGVLAVLSGMSNMEQFQDNVSYMTDFKPVTEEEKKLLEFTKAEFVKNWKYNCDNWEALDDNQYGVPLSPIIRCYNSLQLQPNSYFGAELNYYKSYRSGFDRAYENGDYSAITKKIGGAFDVTAAVRETIEFETKNSFQGYVQD